MNNLMITLMPDQIYLIQDAIDQVILKYEDTCHRLDMEDLLERDCDYIQLKSFNDYLYSIVCKNIDTSKGYYSISVSAAYNSQSESEGN